MAHKCVLGKFGSGKSNFGTDLAIDEIIHGWRPIVTTLALDMPRLNEYVQQLDPDRDHKVWQRVFVLNKEQMGLFWRYRGVAGIGEYGQEPILWGPCGDHAKDKGDADPKWESVTQGVLYLIDEAPVKFHSRNFQERSTEFSDYITQHRKLGDDVYSFSRASALLDKQFRLTADSCIVLDNWYQKVISIFTAPKKIKAYHYENCPPEKGEDPVKTETKLIDPQGLSSCYFTTKGVGIAGLGVADMGKNAKGLPWWTIFPIALCAALAVWFIASRMLHFGAAWGAPKIRVSTVQTNATAAAALGHVMPGFGTFTNQIHTNTAQLITPPSQLTLNQATSPTDLNRDAPLKVYGYSRFTPNTNCPYAYCLDTEAGPIYGTNLVIRGSLFTLDGEPFRKARRALQAEPSDAFRVPAVRTMPMR